MSAVPALHEGRADLLRRVHQALQMAGHALAAAVAQAERPEAHEPAAGGVRPLVLDKVMAEAAMLMRSAAHLRDESAALAAAFTRLARQVAPQARRDAVLVRLCREPGRAIEHAAAHVYLSDLGHVDEGFDRFLREVMAGEPAGGPEQLPNHALECHWLAQMHAGTLDTADVDAALLARTCVARPLDLLGCDTLDLYAFTHVLLYASDMGRRRAAWPRPVDEIAADAEAALAAALDADNFDLAAELLWAWPMLGLRWSHAARFGFELLAAVQDECGFLPGPQFQGPADGAAPALHGVHDAPHDDHVLRTSYHATLVMGMLCAAALRPGRAPGHGGIAAASAEGGAIETLLQLMTGPPHMTRTPRWRAALAAHDSTHRSGLAPFVLSLVLRRAAAAHDLAGLRRGLEAALACDLTDGPAVRQALSLLRRATSLARLNACVETGLRGRQAPGSTHAATAGPRRGS